MQITGTDIIKFIVSIGFLAYGYDQYFVFHNPKIALVCIIAILFIFPLSHRVIFEKSLNIYFSPNAKFFMIVIFLLIIGMLQKRH
jgi:hypothetical protein